MLPIQKNKEIQKINHQDNGKEPQHINSRVNDINMSPVSNNLSLYSREFGCAPVVKGNSEKELDVGQEHLLQVKADIEMRWEKVKATKRVFTPYERKTNEEIINEFLQLQVLRKNLWHCNLGQEPLINHPEYKIAPQLLDPRICKRYAQLLAFDYNCVDGSYNASTILLHGHHFIALEEPMQETLNAFFMLLMKHQARILVRLKPEGEYADKGSLSYWQDRITKSPDCSFIQLGETHSPILNDTFLIPYFYTNNWVDNQGIEVADLYNLVQEVRKADQNTIEKGPLAIHCAAGIGRTGTFIAAHVIANTLDHCALEELSIEEIVLKLSIQRSRMVSTAEQYLLLYKFVEYYLAQKMN